MADKRAIITRACNRIAKISLIAFGLGLATAVVVINIDAYESIATPVALVSALLTIVSGPVYVFTLIARDIVSLGYTRWQFSLRGIFTLMTLVAIFVGAIGVLINWMRQ